MASTRDKNSKGNYKLEQQQLNNIKNNLEYYNSPNGHAVNSAFPEHYRQGYMPADNFTHNSIDVESTLFGIGSSNLEEKNSPAIPQFKKMPTISFFKTPEIVKSEKFKHLEHQRPFIM